MAVGTRGSGARGAWERRARNARSQYRSASHLVRRFGGALWPAGPELNAETWVRGLLSPAELTLWSRMSGPDRRHAVAVARRVSIGLDRGLPALQQPDPVVVLAAALLHDVGKLEAGLGTLSRVGATLAGLALGRSRLADADHASQPPMVAKIGQYLAHDRLGSQLLSAAGSHPLVVAWAAQHHLAASSWDLPYGMGSLLKAADDD